MSEKTARELLAELEEKYGDDPDAYDHIRTAKKDIPYLEKMEKKAGYDGQTALENIMELADFLAYWY